MRTHRIVIEPTGVNGERGQRYRVHFEGAILIEDCWCPEFEAARALVTRGLAGRLEVWRAGKAYPGIIITDIGAAAFRTVIENEKTGPVLPPWRPRPDDSWSDADCDNSRLAPAAEKIFRRGNRLPMRTTAKHKPLDILTNSRFLSAQRMIASRGP